MATTVGVLPVYDLDNLKRYSLLFDELFISAPFTSVSAMGFDGADPLQYVRSTVTRDELDWLTDSGLLVDYTRVIREELQRSTDGEHNVYAHDAFKLLTAPTLASTLQSDLASSQMRITLGQLIARRDASALQSAGVSAATVTSSAKEVNTKEKLLRKEQVLSCILRQLPSPSDITPWQDIMEFKRDPLAREAYLRLRHWVNRVVSQTNPVHEVEEELEYLLSEYANHLKLHSIKSRKSILEVIIVGVANVVEDTIKLKFGALAKGLFDLKQQRIALSEAEQKAPGREVAFIHRASRSLQDPK